MEHLIIGILLLLLAAAIPASGSNAMLDAARGKRKDD
jgi:hypothetical protein